MTRPVLLPNQDPFLQASQNRGPTLPRTPGPGLTDTFNHVSPSAARDPYEQPPMTPRAQSDSFATAQMAPDVADQLRPGSEGNFSASSDSPMNSQGQQFSNVAQHPGPVPSSGVTDTQNTVNMSQADTEKLRQVTILCFKVFQIYMKKL